MSRRSQITYATIRTEGSLLPPDLLERIHKLDPELGGLHRDDFRLPQDGQLGNAITESWLAIQTHFASFRRTMELVRREGGTGTSETRAWVQQVLRELGYRELRFVQAAETIDGRNFLVSHRAGETENAPPVHIVSFSQGIDERTGRTGGGEQRSSHALVQGYLNASDHLWGVVTNGLTFRLLRENRQIDRTLRVDFDLEGMLEATSFAEFRLFWLILHRSRFVQPGERNESAWLERWSQRAASEGTRALTGLRDGVERAIEALGQGLLSHPENVCLRKQLATGELTVDAYYSELLRLVYRLLFLLVAEERGLLFGPDASQRAIERYSRHYSVERLRQEAARVRHREAHHDDLWRGLLVTFDAMRYPAEAKALGLEPLGGGLFGSGSCPHVADDAAPDTAQDGDRTAGRPLLANAALLDAIEALSEVTRDGVTRRINYRDLDVEELGSVYEGLLEHRPALTTTQNGTYQFGFGASTSRKETGSYYTPRSLVQELLSSALDPVINTALERASITGAQERALLDLNVCDPACGSGHFLLGAARRIGRRLAEVRAGAHQEPEPADLRRATSEAIRHCIYGVDKNPLAIDLCKTALWIESHEPGRPIGFLDHHIKRGDSLVGVFNLDVLQEGIPDGAYTAVTSDEKPVANGLKKRNRAERSKLTVTGNGKAAMHNASLFAEGEREDILKGLAAELDQIDSMPERTVDEVRAKAAAYERLHGRDEWQSLSTACDLWTWAFFAPVTKETRQLVPTSAAVRQMIEKGTVPAHITGQAQAAAADVGFFHWRLAFPEVFRTWSSGGGFDAVLGNPPWERVKLQEKEFFAEHDPEIATAPNKAARDRLIKKLPETNPALAIAFVAAKREAENASVFMRTSGRFPLTGRGDINTYAVFSEIFTQLTSRNGRAGAIVPTGIATDDTTKFFFQDVMSANRLVHLLSFENEERLFIGVNNMSRFCLLVLSGQSINRPADFVFFARRTEHLHDSSRHFSLTVDDLELFSPNTGNCPTFRTTRDADLNRKIYRSASVLIDESKGPAGNPWGASFIRMFDMANDSRLFRTRDELESCGARLDRMGSFRLGNKEWHGLYEGRMIHQFDHRFGTYEGQTQAQANKGILPRVTPSEHADPAFVSRPNYWVEREEVDRRASRDRHWFIGFRDITNANNERTAIFTTLPRAAVNNKLPLVFLDVTPKKSCAFVGNTNSFCFDYAARQKVGSTNLTYFILKQLPVLAPHIYTGDLLDLIIPRVLELTYTAHDMEPFARDLGYDGPPFIWNEERRAKLRAELDGIYAHLYGISREDFAYILDTFPIVARKDVDKYGEYRTKRLCLEAYDHFAPETLRALELEVRKIEGELRRVIVRALDNDPGNLPSDLREELVNARMQHVQRSAADALTLRELLESAYMLQLGKIIRSDTVWPFVGDRFGTKSTLRDKLGRLNAFRNPLAHGRSLNEEVRIKGEEAIGWFRDRLDLVPAL